MRDPLVWRLKGKIRLTPGCGAELLNACPSNPEATATAALVRKTASATWGLARGRPHGVHASIGELYRRRPDTMVASLLRREGESWQSWAKEALKRR
jgi:hypothetical protein